MGTGIGNCITNIFCHNYWNFLDVNRRIDDIRDDVKGLKDDVRKLKTLMILFIQKEAGLKSKEEIQKALASEE